MHNRVRLLFWCPVSIVVGASSFVLVKLLLAIRERQRQGSCRTLFYRLFMVQSIIELFLIYLYLAGRLLIKDQLLGRDFILSLNGWFFPPFYYYGTMAYFFNVQVWGVMMHSLVRFAYICAPRLQSLLDRIPGPAWFLLNTLVPFAVFARFLFQDPVSFETGEDGFAAISAPFHVVHSNAIQSTIVTVIGSAFCAACYAFVLRQLVRFRQVQVSSIADYSHERALTIVGFVLFISQCTMTSCYLAIMISHDVLVFKLVRDLIVFPVILVTFVNSWMLTATNRSLRKL